MQFLPHSDGQVSDLTLIVNRLFYLIQANSKLELLYDMKIYIQQTTTNNLLQLSQRLHARRPVDCVGRLRHASKTIVFTLVIITTMLFTKFSCIMKMQYTVKWRVDSRPMGSTLNKQFV